jgi:hypothetical protein
MDKNAKAYLPSARSRPRHHAIYLEPWSIWYGGEKITNTLHSTIYSLVHSAEAKQYWLQKKHLTQDTLDLVHWDALHQAFCESTQSRRSFIIKSSVGMCGVGKFLKRWKQSSSSACPRCLSDPEDMLHVWRCQAPEVKDLWSTTLSDLHTWLNEQKTDPSLTELLLDYLSCWRDSSPYTAATNRFHELVEHQSSIGWDGPFYGWMSCYWAKIQQDHFNFIRSRRTGRRWLVAVIKKLWEVSWDFWSHRNGVMHHKTQIGEADLLCLDRSVSSTYRDLLQQPSRSTRHLTFLPLRNILAKDCRYKTVWLRQASAAVAKTNRGARQSLLKMRRCLEAWLRRARQSKN